MSTPEALLQERRERLEKTIRLEKTDRTPVILMADTFMARTIGLKAAELCKGVDASSTVMSEGAAAVGHGLDGVNGAFASAPFFPLQFMSRIQLPGRELPEDSVWQLDERELMTHEDYDAILDKGWSAFYGPYVRDRLGIDLPALMKDTANAPKALEKFHSKGFLVYQKLVTITVNESLSGGRSMSKFNRDLFTMPDKVEAVLDIVLKDSLELLGRQIQGSPNPSPVVSISPARGASEFFSPKLWERFVFKYLKAAADFITERGYICNIHCDSNWERDLDYFRVFKPGTVVFESDSGTNMAKLREKLGGHLAIKGDVPANLLVLGTPEQVHSYCRDLIDASDGRGLILSCGCSCPQNAKLENVRAMISAATGE
jgi:uroporphyrinogen-III decarboxylase